MDIDAFLHLVDSTVAQAVRQAVSMALEDSLTQIRGSTIDTPAVHEFSKLVHENAAQVSTRAGREASGFRATKFPQGSNHAPQPKTDQITEFMRKIKPSNSVFQYSSHQQPWVWFYHFIHGLQQYGIFHPPGVLGDTSYDQYAAEIMRKVLPSSIWQDIASMEEVAARVRQEPCRLARLLHLCVGTFPKVTIQEFLSTPAKGKQLNLPQVFADPAIQGLESVYHFAPSTLKELTQLAHSDPGFSAFITMEKGKLDALQLTAAELGRIKKSYRRAKLAIHRYEDSNTHAYEAERDNPPRKRINVHHHVEKSSKTHTSAEKPCRKVVMEEVEDEFLQEFKNSS